MTLKVYNTLTRKMEPFEPQTSKKVSIYVCGPTVYDYSHIGHARTYIAFDVIVRYLKYRGYNVKYVVNITNVEDKIMNRAREVGVDPVELAAKFEKVFFADMTRLGVMKADAYPRVSDHINEIIEMIQTLIRKGFGYVVDGDVYFDVTRFERYGGLSRQSLERIEAGARIEVDERKRNPADFALWKTAKSGEISWDSPWGKGRPGWHIECSAMANKYLGSQFDIHGGGRDLMFPHHENEIAQSEAYSGKSPAVKYWLHTGLLTINGEKMSKSLGNFTSIGDLLSKFDAEALRLYIISAHYRRPVDFREENLKAAEQRLARIYDTVDRLHTRIESAKDGGVKEVDEVFRKQISSAKERFLNAMDSDFDTPRVLAAFYRLVQVGNKALATDASKSVLVEVHDLIMDMAKVFGILGRETKKAELPEEADQLLKEREVARSRKDWKRADEMREKLKGMGIIVEDLPEGTRWRFKEQGAS